MGAAGRKESTQLQPSQGHNFKGLDQLKHFFLGVFGDPARLPAHDAKAKKKKGRMESIPQFILTH